MNIWQFLLIITTSILNLNCFNNCDSFKEINNKIYGIDISHYQNNNGQINWEKVSQHKNPKITFAYIRTTMGKDGVDHAFEENFKEAKKHGIKVGVYHYYRPNENSTEQFENFIKNTPEIGDMPPVLDIEEISDFGSRNLMKGIRNFLNLTERKYTKTPIIYTPQKFYNIYFRNKFSEYEFWIARQNGFKQSPDNNQIKKEPFLFDGRCPLIWQYSGTGTINGIDGYVDLNILSSLNLQEFYNEL